MIDGGYSWLSLASSHLHSPFARLIISYECNYVLVCRKSAVLGEYMYAVDVLELSLWVYMYM